MPVAKQGNRRCLENLIDYEMPCIISTHRNRTCSLIMRRQLRKKDLKVIVPRVPVWQHLPRYCAWYRCRLSEFLTLHLGEEDSLFHHLNAIRHSGSNCLHTNWRGQIMLNSSYGKRIHNIRSDFLHVWKPTIGAEKQVEADAKLQERWDIRLIQK